MNFKSLRRTISVWTLFLMVVGPGCSQAGREATHRERGNEAFGKGDYSSAEIEYLNALRLNPDNPETLSKLGFIYLDQTRGQRAYELLKRAQELSPNDLKVRLKLAQIYIVAGNEPKARAELLSTLQSDPQNQEAILLLCDLSDNADEILSTQQEFEQLRQKAGDSAALHVAAGIFAQREKKLTEAEAEFKKAIAMAPNAPEAYAALGNLYWGSTNLIEAEKSLKEAADRARLRSGLKMRFAEFKLATGNRAEAKLLMENQAKATPDFLPVLNRLAELEMGGGNLDKAGAWLSKSLTLEAASSQTLLIKARLELARSEFSKAAETLEYLQGTMGKSAELHYLLGVAYVANQEKAKGLAALERALTLNPNHASAVILYSEINNRGGRPGDSIPRLVELLKAQPGNLQAYLTLGDAHRIRRAYDEAVEVCRVAAQRFPRNPRIPLLMGLVLREQGKTAEARQAFEEAAKLAPGQSFAFQQLVDLDLEDRNYTSAMTRVDRAKKESPTNAAPWFQESRIHLAKQDTNQAVASLRKAIEVDPDYSASFITLVGILADSRRVDEALGETDQALRGNPKDVEALFMRGVLQAEKGNYDGARQSYEAILEVNPDHVRALNNLAYLYSVWLNQPGKALENARKARRLRPADGRIADTLGWILYQAGDYSASLPLLQESAQDLSDKPEVQYHLGMAHYMMGNEAQARMALQKAVQGSNEFAGKDDAKRKLQVLGDGSVASGTRTVEALEKAIAQDRTDMIAMLRLAALYEKSGSAAKAKEMAEASLKLNPKAARALLVLARVYASQPGETRRAVDYAKNARDLAPDDPEIAHEAGRLAFQSGQYEWAYSILQDSHRKLAGDPEALFDYAWSAYSVGRVAEAEASMQTALSAGTNFGKAALAKRFLEVVGLVRSPDRIAAASPMIEATLKADPGYVPALFVAGLAWERRGDYAQAQRLFEQILSLYPQFTPAARQLALIFANHIDNVQKGYELAVKARQASPDDLELLKALAKLSYRRGDHQYASQLLKDYMRKKSSDAEAYYYLGLCQHQLKQNEAAAASLRQALSLPLDPKLTNEAHRVLAAMKL